MNPAGGAAARLVREGEHWLVTFGDRVSRVPHSEGMGYLAELLADPGREMAPGALTAVTGASSGDEDVARAIDRAIPDLRRGHAELSSHLRTCVRTGALCIYDPPVGEDVRWEVSERARPAAEAGEGAAGPVLMALLFTDLIESSGMFRRLGEERAEAVWRQHLSLMRAAAAGFGGEEVKTLGDGLMMAFERTTDTARMQAHVHGQALRGRRRAAAHPDRGHRG